MLDFAKKMLEKLLISAFSSPLSSLLNNKETWFEWQIFHKSGVYTPQIIKQSFITVIIEIIASLSNRMAGRHRMAEWKKNVARECAFPILRNIFPS